MSALAADDVRSHDSSDHSDLSTGERDDPECASESAAQQVADACAIVRIKHAGVSMRDDRVPLSRSLAVVSFAVAKPQLAEQPRSGSGAYFSLEQLPPLSDSDRQLLGDALTRCLLPRGMHASAKRMSQAPHERGSTAHSATSALKRSRRPRGLDRIVMGVHDWCAGPEGARGTVRHHSRTQAPVTNHAHSFLNDEFAWYAVGHARPPAPPRSHPPTTA